METITLLGAASVQIRPWQSSDQDAAKSLILTGLGERWGLLDPTLNPDLDDIGHSYADAVFLVGMCAGTLVATGALVPEAPGIGRIVRMSVRRERRGQGIGRAMLAALLAQARAQGIRHVLLETTSTWRDAVRFYTTAGFHVTHEADDETHMLLELE